VTRIAIGWELGSSPDLLYDVRDVGRMLASHGHDISYIVADPVALAALFSPQERPEILPAPLPSARPEAVAKTAREGGFVDKLAVQGFGAVESLKTLAEVWSRLLVRERTELVISIGAPVLALAARGLRPLFVLGSVESMPPPEMTRFPRIVANVAPALTDEKLLANANAVASAIGGRPVGQPPALISGDATLVYGMPQLDPYLPLRSARSAPLRPPVKVATPAGSPALVAALDVGHPFIDTVVIALTDLARAPVHVHIKGATRPMRTYLAQTNGIVLHERLEAALAHVDEATYVLHHCSPMAAEAALAAGRPHVLLPYIHEQGVVASFLERSACAHVLTSPMSAPDLADYFVRQFRDLNLTQQAQLIARDLAAVRFPDTMAAIANVCAKLAA
jgi:hypothetical protein